MRGEAGEIGLDRLCVADVGVDGVEEWERRGVGRHGQASLRHQREKTCSLQRNRLTAGVGAADDELAGFGFQCESERDGRSAGAAQAKF